MPRLEYGKRVVESREGETVLDAFLRQGVGIPFSCQSGVCHACMRQCVDGYISPEAQAGLSLEQVSQGCFLPCQCVPMGDMEIVSPDAQMAGPQRGAQQP